MSGTKFVAVPVHGKTQHEVFHVEERYTSLKVIGSGSYGVVCSAVDTVTNSKVAIKKVTDALEDLVDAGRVLRELRVLRHIGGRENTLKIRDTYTYPPDTPDFDDVYIVTDLMETDMDRVLRSSQGLSTQHFGYFLYQLLRSVANMHHASVLHRDLKPSNLLVNANCDLVVCDFGLARGVSNTAKQPPNTGRTDRGRAPLQTISDDTNDFLTEYVVTRWYRPPEILAESPYYGAAADIWSVGCIFGEMLDKRRRPIFRGKNPQNQMQLIVSALGCPTDAELDFCTSTSSRGVIRRVCERTKAEGIEPWDFQERFKGADPLALDLLQKMLVFDPNKRITAAEALCHPFLSEIHSHWHKMRPAPKFDFSFEKVHHERHRDRIIPKKDLQNLYLYEVNKYRTVHCRIPTPLHLKRGPAASRNGNRGKRSSQSGTQILKIDHSNQQDALDDTISTLPMIGGSSATLTGSVTGREAKESKMKGSSKAKDPEPKTKEKEVRTKSSKLSFRKRVPVMPVKEDKFSQSLKPPSNTKDKMLSRTRQKSTSTSALLQKKPSARGHSSLIRRASKKLFDS